MVASTGTVGLDLPSIKREARAGNLSVEQLLDIFERQHRVMANQQASLERLVARLEIYELTVREEFQFNRFHPDGSSSSPPPKYSLDAEEKRRKRKRRQRSSGRRPTAAKFAEATQFEDVYSDKVSKNDADPCANGPSGD